jgi:MFS family permease
VSALLQHRAPASTNPSFWLVVTLLSAAVFINYLDRGALSIAAPAIKRELHVSNVEMGVLLSAFFWVYAPGQLVAGWLTQRFGARFVLAAGLTVWSLATFATGLVGGFALILALRLAIGFGETAIFPCSAKIIAERARPDKRGAPNGVFVAAMALGPVAGTLVGGLIVAAFGWRAIFLAFGIASLVWLAPWLSLRKTAIEDRPDDLAAPSFVEIISRRDLWGVSIGHFTSAYALYFMLTWLPLYLVEARHFSLQQMAVTGSIVYAIYAASSSIVGWGTDQLIAGGADESRLRKLTAMAGAGGVALAMLLSAQQNISTNIVAICLAGFFLGFQTPMVLAAGQTLAGASAGGRWMGVQNALGNISGIVAPILTGWVVDTFGGYEWAFLFAASLSLVGLLAWAFVVGPLRQLSWPQSVGSCRS